MTSDSWLLCGTHLVRRARERLRNRSKNRIDFVVFYKVLQSHNVRRRREDFGRKLGRGIGQGTRAKGGEQGDEQWPARGRVAVGAVAKISVSLVSGVPSIRDPKGPHLRETGDNSLERGREIPGLEGRRS